MLIRNLWIDDKVGGGGKGRTGTHQKSLVLWYGSSESYSKVREFGDSAPSPKGTGA